MKIGKQKSVNTKRKKRTEKSRGKHFSFFFSKFSTRKSRRMQEKVRKWNFLMGHSCIYFYFDFFQQIFNWTNFDQVQKKLNEKKNYKIKHQFLGKICIFCWEIIKMYFYPSECIFCACRSNRTSILHVHKMKIVLVFSFLDRKQFHSNVSNSKV